MTHSIFDADATSERLNRTHRPPAGFGYDGKGQYRLKRAEDAIASYDSCMPIARIPRPRASRMRVRASMSGSPVRGSWGR